MLSELKFPAICFWSDFIRIPNNLNALTTTTKAGLKNGMFRNLLIVDSDGLTVRVKDACKLHGVGLFWGYNIFLNQRIKVQLQIQDSFQMQLDEVKKRVFDSFQKRHGWKTRGDFNELKNSIKKAKSISDIIRCLTEETAA